MACPAHDGCNGEGVVDAARAASKAAAVAIAGDNAAAEEDDDEGNMPWPLNVEAVRTPLQSTAAVIQRVSSTGSLFVGKTPTA
jgi:hypothetical protein